MTEQCMARVSERPWYIHHHQCPNKAKGVRLFFQHGGPSVEGPACGLHLRPKQAPYIWDGKTR